MEKVIILNFDGKTRLFEVDASLSPDNIRERITKMAEEQLAAGETCLVSELSNEVYIAHGLTPYGAEEVHVIDRDLRGEKLEALGIAVANCYECSHCEEGCCMRYGGSISDGYDDMDCCKNDYLYEASYTRPGMDTPDVYERFVLKNEELLDNRDSLMEVLIAAFPGFAELKARSDYNPACFAVKKV